MELELSNDALRTANLISLVRDVHHWIIEEPEGPTSLGTCKNCGTQREFKNWLDTDLVTNEEHRVIRESDYR